MIEIHPAANLGRQCLSSLKFAYAARIVLAVEATSHNSDRTGWWATDQTAYAEMKMAVITNPTCRDNENGNEYYLWRVLVEEWRDSILPFQYPNVRIFRVISRGFLFWKIQTDIGFPSPSNRPVKHLPIIHGLIHRRYKAPAEIGRDSAPGQFASYNPRPIRPVVFAVWKMALHNVF